ncbi:YggS family pyridoxal phosphate-dependent enzyme [bacterium]|nr:YggS family pyridoxal phosphate-dependent enzyme [bacterium]
MIEKIKNNLLRIQEEIVPYTVNIIAVTKYYDKDVMLNAYKAGLRHFGESRAVEAVKKIGELPNDVKENSTFHFIGHLQSNKVKLVVNNFDYIHSVDSSKIANLISDEALKLGKKQKVFLQLNNAEEEQKFGFNKQELLNEFKSITDLEGLEVLGLMNIAPLTESKEELAKLFKDVKDFQKELETKFDFKLNDISMGMSNDYDIAVANGATWVRIGRKLFS